MARTDPKKDMPWSVKGVSKEAREVVKKAAAEQGVTMGEWLSQAIRADLDASGGSNSDGAPVGPSALAEPEATNPRQIMEAAAPRDVEERLRRGIAEKIVESENRILNVVKPLQEIIQQMALRIELLENRNPPSPENDRPRPVSGPPGYRKTGWDE
jgi:hypothetical protein